MAYKEFFHFAPDCPQTEMKRNDMNEIFEEV